MSNFIKLSQYESGSFRQRLRDRLRRRRLSGVLGELILTLRKMGIDTVPRAILALIVLFFFLSSFSLAALSISLPSPFSLSVARPTESTKIFDRNGVPLYDIFSEEKRTAIPFDLMPEQIKQATIAVEDADFYHHIGFDLKGIFRGVFLKPLLGRGVQGGSTITQQFVKNAFLSPSRTLARKMRELILALELEQVYTKDKILEMYLNEIPYGNNAYGIEVASETYFDKKASELSLAEAATLAAIPRAPTYYSPYGQHVDDLLLRKDFVLKRMKELSYIDEEEYEAAKAEKIEFQSRREAIKAPHFVIYVKELLAEKYGERFLEQGGLKIYTTLDYEKQKAAEEAIAARADFNAKNYNASNAAFVSIDPQSGQILAMVGSKDYFNLEIDGNVNVTLRPRQPGSSIKPVIYATAFKQGFSPATMLLDVKTDFGQGYSPGDYDGMERGPVSIRQALGNSINIPAVKTLALVGVNKAVETANDLGIMSLNDPDRYGLSLVLGGGEVTLLELTSAYGVFATGGIYHEPVAVLRVEDKRGKILQEWKESSGKKVLDSQVAYLINNILSDDEARAMVFGLGSSLTLPGRVVAAKTGTTDGYRDGWTVGYTPSLVAGAWVGNNDNSSMNRAGGSMGAAPIWNRYMKVALKGVENEAFEEPPGITRVTVDRLSGKLPTDATPDTKTEVFSSFGVPKEKDDVHVKVRVVSLAPDKLPPANFPSELTEERIFTVLHSERPDYSNWENPVIAWAKANGYNNVPTETYGGSVEIGGSDRVKITSPQNGAVIKGSFEVRVEPQEGELEKVELYLDGKLKGTLVSSPYLFSLIPELDGEIHHLLAKGYAGGSSYQYKIYLTFGERVGPSSRYLSLGYPTETKFPLTLKINLTAEGEKLSLVNFRYFLDSSLVSTTTAREIKIDSGSSGQHEAFVKMITQDGQVIISSPIRFNTK